MDSPIGCLEPVTDNIVCSVRFRDPKYKKGHKYPAIRLSGAKDPPRVLKPEDLTAQQNRNWRAQTGMVPATQR